MSHHVVIVSDDLTGVINLMHDGFGGIRHIDGGENALRVDEAVPSSQGVVIVSDNLAGAIDAGGICRTCLSSTARRIASMLAPHAAEPATKIRLPRTLPAQKTEARAACSVLNRMTRLGMPVSQRTA